VVFSSLLLFRKLKISIIITALVGMVGAALVISSGKDPSFSMEYMKGYMLALFCGIIWSSFSVALGQMVIKREPMTVFTIYAAILSAMLYLATMPHGLPSMLSLISAIYLGCVPLGLSFFLWNRALTGGNMVIIGFLSYFTPPLAVLMVALIHGEKISSQVLIGMVIILAAAVGGKMSLTATKKYTHFQPGKLE
jgi:drug/metabolite transporter (DMT)-like permease